MVAIQHSYELKAMSIIELSSYYNIVKTMVDSCLFRLKLQLPQDEKIKVNNKRLKYNEVLDKIEQELNNRIEQICTDNE